MAAIHTTSIIISVFCVFNAQGRVVQDLGECSPDHFYQGIAPLFSFSIPGNYTSICQTLNGTEHFATLYNRQSRIPVFSAYQPERETSSGRQRRTETWYIEPQLAQLNSDLNMKRLSQTDISAHEIKQSQAHDDDYKNTGYDKGHLNPNGHHSNAQARDATFTLTNAVPQDPCLNRIYWFQMEEHVKKSLRAECNYIGAKHYIITGSSKDTIHAIPRPYDRDENTTQGALERVDVPSFLWSAVCCDTSQTLSTKNQHKGWSFGFYGTNKPESSIEIMTVQQLNAWLSSQYGSVNLFSADPSNCVFNETHSEKQHNAASKLVLKQALKMLEANKLSGPRSTTAMKRMNNVLDGDIMIKSMKMDMDMDVSYLISEKEAVFTAMAKESLFCQQLSPKRAIWKRSWTNQATCRVETIEKHMKDITTAGKKCLKGHKCEKHGRNYLWCYVGLDGEYGRCCETPCSRNPDASTTEDPFVCKSGSNSKEVCVIGARLDVTIGGRRCRSDHPCAKHGKGYYWCQYGDQRNWDYCCAASSICAHHGNTYTWCNIYDDSTSSWQYCIPSEIINPITHD